MSHSLALAIGIVALVIVVILLVHHWAGEPGRTVIRYKMIGLLWQERETLRGYIAQHHLTHWETTQLQDRIREINDSLILLGVPRENLQ